MKLKETWKEMQGNKGLNKEYNMHTNTNQQGCQLKQGQEEFDIWSQQENLKIVKTK